VADFRAGLARLAALRCDTLLTPHPIASSLHARAIQGLSVETAGCQRYAQSLTARLDTRLAEEAARR
jgi:metallo-beta-lactamase class B